MTSTRLLHELPSPETEAAFYSGVAVKRGLAWVFDAVLIGILCTLALPFTAFTGIFYFPLLMLVVWGSSTAGSRWQAGPRHGGCV
jgi:hypothetical protein